MASCDLIFRRRRLSVVGRRLREEAGRLRPKRAPEFDPAGIPFGRAFLLGGSWANLSSLPSIRQNLGRSTSEHGPGVLASAERRAPGASSSWNIASEARPSRVPRGTHAPECDRRRCVFTVARFEAHRTALPKAERRSRRSLRTQSPSGPAMRRVTWPDSERAESCRCRLGVPAESGSSR